MPKGIIYKFYNTEKPEEFLIGSTTSDLKTCRNKFLHDMKNAKGHRRVNTKLRTFASTVALDKWVMVELDTVEFKDRCELKQLEILYIRKHNPTLNKHHVMTRVKCEYCGKELNKRSLKSHVKQSCPVRGRSIPCALLETNLYKGRSSNCSN